MLVLRPGVDVVELRDQRRFRVVVHVELEAPLDVHAESLEHPRDDGGQFGHVPGRGDRGQDPAAVRVEALDAVEVVQHVGTELRSGDVERDGRGDVPAAAVADHLDHRVPRQLALERRPERVDDRLGGLITVGAADVDRCRQVVATVQVERGRFDIAFVEHLPDLIEPTSGGRNVDRDRHVEDGRDLAVRVAGVENASSTHWKPP